MPKLIAMLIIVCLGISTILIITKFQSGNETRSNPGWQVEIEQGFLEESSRLYRYLNCYQRMSPGSPYSDVYLSSLVHGWVEKSTPSSGFHTAWPID